MVRRIHIYSKWHKYVRKDIGKGMWYLEYCNLKFYVFLHYPLNDIPTIW